MNEQVNLKKISETEWFCAFKLPNDVHQYLWHRIEEAKKENEDHRENLAGNISHSLTLRDPNNWIVDKIFYGLFNSDLKQFFTDRVDRVTRGSFDKGSVGLKPELTRMWVNFQKKYEYNPLHDHSGAFSFVIWMKIPYDWKDERELPWVKGIKTDTAGNFCFLDRSFTTHTLKMDKNVEGYCCFFPSDFHHQVYPFYTSDEERISISGNIFFVEP